MCPSAPWPGLSLAALLGVLPVPQAPVFVRVPPLPVPVPVPAGADVCFTGSVAAVVSVAASVGSIVGSVVSSPVGSAVGWVVSSVAAPEVSVSAAAMVVDSAVSAAS